MKLSLCCVTKNRRAFLPWLRWNIDKQNYKGELELVVVDSSDYDHAYTREIFPEAVIVDLPSDKVTGDARQAALDAATGEIITWFDDDDWYHPHKLNDLMAALLDDPDCPGTYAPYGGHLIMRTGARYDGKIKGVLRKNLGDLSHTYGILGYNPAIQSLMCWMKYAKQSEFPRTLTAEDTVWMQGVLDAAGPGAEFKPIDMLTTAILLVHDSNAHADMTTIEQTRMILTDTPPSDVPQEAWDETWGHLQALQERIDAGER